MTTQKIKELRGTYKSTTSLKGNGKSAGKKVHKKKDAKKSAKNAPKIAPKKLAVKKPYKVTANNPVPHSYTLLQAHQTKALHVSILLLEKKRSTTENTKNKKSAKSEVGKRKKIKIENDHEQGKRDRKNG